MANEYRVLGTFQPASVCGMILQQKTDLFYTFRFNIYGMHFSLFEL